MCGDTVELKDAAGRVPGRLHYGDFLRVLTVIRNVETGKATLRGHVFRRTARRVPLFDGTSPWFPAPFNASILLTEAKASSMRRS